METTRGVKGKRRAGGNPGYERKNLRPYPVLGKGRRKPWGAMMLAPLEVDVRLRERH